MAVWGEIQHKGDITDIKQVMNYVYQLEEQIRYALMHLGDENITPGSIGVEQLEPGFTQNINQIEINVEAAQNRIRETGSILNNRLTDAEGNISSLTQTASGLSTRVSTAEGNISSLTQTATSLTTRVSNAEGDISTLVQTASGLGTRVTNAEGDISTLTQTASGLQTRVGNAEGDISTLTQTASGLSTRVGTAEGNISSLQQTASSISASVSSIQTNGVSKVSNTSVTINTSGVEIKSTGTLKVSMTNFKIDSSGNVTVTGTVNATGGQIGSFDIINDGFGSLTREVVILQDQISVGPVADRGVIAGGNGISAKALRLYDANAGSYRDVTAAVLALL